MSTVQYSIQLATGIPPAAGSNANIYVSLWGQKGKSPELHPTGLNQDSVCTCSISCEDLGMLSAVCIRSDAGSSSPGWYARYIVVTNLTENRTFLASLERWLDQSRSSTSVITLHPLGPAEARRPIVTYRVKTRTAGDGTDSRILFQLGGELAETCTFDLEIPGKDVLEPGQHDVCRIAWPDLGAIEQVNFWNEGDDSLTLESVSVTQAVSGRKWRGNGGVVPPHSQDVPFQVSPEIIPSRPEARPTPSRPDARPTPSRPDARPTPSRPEARPTPSRPEARPTPSRPEARPTPSRPESRPMPSRPEARPTPSRPEARPSVPSRPSIRLPEGSRQNYYVEVRTDRRTGAGTNANVWCCLLGTETDSGWIQLDNGKDNFEAGSIDLFTIHLAQPLGELRGLMLRQDNSQTAPGWYVNQVTCTDMVAGTVTDFPCYCWLASDEEDGQTQRIFYPTSRPAVPLPADYPYVATAYDVTVITSSFSTAGTDADVTLQLLGVNGRASRVFQLDHPDRNDFEADSLCRFTVVAETELVDVAAIRIGHNNTGPCPSWHLDSVTLTNRTTGRVSQFPCRRWLASDEDDFKTQRLLYPTEVPFGVEDPASYRKLAREYNVGVRTGNRQNAGTNANVYVTLTGTNGRSERRLLDCPLWDDFEQGQYDHYALVLQGDIGQLFAVRVEHDNQEASPGWFLENLTFSECFRNRRTYRFPCHRWLATDEDDGKICRDLRTSASLFTFSVTTGGCAGAGTDADVFVRLVGTRGVSAFYELDTPGYNDFEQDDCDQYQVYIQEEIGDLQYVDVRQNGEKPAPDWFLNWIHVRDSRNGTVTPFVLNGWVKSGSIYRLSPGIVCTVSVKTGSSSYAGTNSNVYLTLHGTNGSTERIELDGPDDDFEKGDVNHFVVGFRRHPGELQRITIYKDNSGPSPDWHLKWVEVIDQSTSRMKHFEFDGLLSSSRRTVTLTPNS